jgi:hypothetical protein
MYTESLFRLFQSGGDGQGGHVETRDHRFAHFGIREVKDTIDELLLLFLKIAALPRHFDQAPQLVLRVNGGMLTRRMKSEQLHGAGAGPIEQADRPVEDLIEQLHRQQPYFSAQSCSFLKPLPGEPNPQVIR